ncbi:amidohydrolase family protein [Sphingomonas koreensis]
MQEAGNRARWSWDTLASSNDAATAGECAASPAPSACFRRNFAATTSGFEPPDVLDLVIRIAGIENVMRAIDYPYESSRDAVAFIEGARLSVEQRASIFHRNAERLFHLK